jgi:selenocysteine lyase/cysteine desulfurase
MTTEGGGSLSKLADILAEDEVGVQAVLAEIGDLVKLVVDSTCTTCSKHAYLTPDDADALADLLKMRAREARGVL